jgi:mRNA deadenylase 3'-5' endonuclease subunit Ccr4
MAGQFSVATYNVLANAYVNPAWYRRTPSIVLNPAWRVPAVVQHASSLKADILCVQELEPDVFASVRAVFAADGYHAQYARKGAGRPDGLAIFYKKEKCELLTTERLPYADGADGTDSGYIALFVVCRSAGELIGIINTHLMWDPAVNPPTSHRGYQQARQLLDAWQQIKSSAKAWVLAGDFNATPESDLVGMICAAGFDYTHRGLAQLGTCNVGGEPRMIDYLFYTGALRAQPRGIVAVDRHAVLPSAEAPSDHVPVVAEFAWKA